MRGFFSFRAIEVAVAVGGNRTAAAAAAVSICYFNLHRTGGT